MEDLYYFNLAIDSIQEYLQSSHKREKLLLLVEKQIPRKALQAIKKIYENNSQYEQWLHRDLLLAGSCLGAISKEIKAKDRDGIALEIINDLVNLEIQDEKKIGSKVKQQVFQVITSLKGTEWATEILNLLKEQQDNIERFRFIEYQVALGEKKEVIKNLSSLLENNSLNLRYTAARILGKIGRGESKVIEALLPLLQDDNSDMRDCAFKALEKIGRGESKVIETLLSLLQDDNPKIRYGAAYTLGPIGEGEQKAIEALLPLLQDDNPKIRYGAACALGQITEGKPKAIEALLPLLQNDNYLVCCNAVEALGEIGKGEPKVIEALLPLLQDCNSNIRDSTVEALGQIGEGQPQVIESLLTLLKNLQDGVSINYGMCYLAIEALGKIGKDEPEVTTVFLSLIQNKNYSVCFRAARALAEIDKDEPEVIIALLSLLQDNSDDAANAIEKIGKGKAKARTIFLVENWLLEHQNTEYIGRGIDVLWNLVTDEN